MLSLTDRDAITTALADLTQNTTLRALFGPRVSQGRLFRSLGRQLTAGQRSAGGQPYTERKSR